MFNKHYSKIINDIVNYNARHKDKLVIKMQERNIDVNILRQCVQTALDFITNKPNDYEDYVDEDDEYADEDVSIELDDSCEGDVSTDNVDNNNEWRSFISGVFMFLFMAQYGAIELGLESYIGNKSLLCKELTSILKAKAQSETNDISNSEESKREVKYNIFASLDEEISFKDYIERKIFLDLDLISELISSIDFYSKDGYNELVLKDIASDIMSLTNCMPKLADYLNPTLNCLKLTYQNTFSLYPYKGVFSFMGNLEKHTSKGVKTQNWNTFIRKGEGNVIELGREVVSSSKFNSLIEEFKKAERNTDGGITAGEDSNIKADLFFIIDDILSSSKPLYYPCFCFTLATGSKLRPTDKHIDGTSVFYKHSGCNSWDEYFDSVSEVITNLFIKYAYKAMEKHAKTLENGEKYSFTHPDFIADYEDSKDEAYSDFMSSESRAKVIDEFKKLTRTVCRAFILARDDLGELFKIIVSSFSPSYTEKSGVVLFGDSSFTDNKSDIKVSDGIKTSIPSISCNIFEYTFAKDISLLDKKPLFGYKAAELFKRQGIAISNSNILIGEDSSGTPLFSKPGTDSKINMTSKIFHRLSSGSRSGKGVMTMNILASLMANDVPVFYVDRKPDMTGELAHLTDGKMFLVNGGSLAQDDVHGAFINDGFMLQPYNSKNKDDFKMPYLVSVFGEDFGTRWDGALGDFVYAKAMIFTLSLVAARVLIKRDGRYTQDAINDLHLNKNIAVVLDEITNWHKAYEDAYFKTDGGNTSPALRDYYDQYLGATSDVGSVDLDNLTAKLSSDAQKLLEGKQLAYNEAYAAWKADETNSKLLKAADTAHKALMKAIEDENKKRSKSGASDKELLTKLYWTTYFDKYGCMVKETASLGNAGIDINMTLENDVFMIGQYINGAANTGNPIDFNKDNSVRATSDLIEQYTKSKIMTKHKSDSCTRSYLYGLADSWGCDWFFGRNFNMPTDTERSQTNPQFGGISLGDAEWEWLHGRGNWAYSSSGKQDKFRGAEKHNIPENMVLFKPYLVLNTNDEISAPDSNSPYNDKTESANSQNVYRYVLGAAKRVGWDTWENLRLEHVKKNEKGERGSLSDRRYGELEPGIGLKGLIEAYRQTKGGVDANYTFNKDLLRKSYDMANSICQKFGYSDYWDYLLDMSPKGLIGLKDLLLVYSDGLSGEELMKKRFPRYYNLGREDLLNCNPLALSEKTSSVDIANNFGFTNTDMVKPDSDYVESHQAPVSLEPQVYHNTVIEEPISEPIRTAQDEINDFLRIEESLNSSKDTSTDLTDSEIQDIVMNVLLESGVVLRGKYLNKFINLCIKMYREMF